MERLLRWRFWKSNPTRAKSSSPLFSTLITLAPISASWRTHVGPERARVRSITVYGSSGKVMSGLRVGWWPDATIPVARNHSSGSVCHGSAASRVLAAQALGEPLGGGGERARRKSARLLRTVHAPRGARGGARRTRLRTGPDARLAARAPRGVRALRRAGRRRRWRPRRGAARGRGLGRGGRRPARRGTAADARGGGERLHSRAGGAAPW